MAEKPSYLGAFLRHPHNRVALLAAACAAIFASIPYGWNGMALVGVLALGTEILAALAIPGLPSFKAWVDREHQARSRLARQQQCLVELHNLGDEATVATWRHMSGRVQALRQSAERAADAGRGALSSADVEKLEDQLVDYLGLSVVCRSLAPRKGADDERTLQQRIAALQSQLQNPALPADEARQLRSALAEYTEAAHRARRLAVRRSALEATLVSMPDKLEEVYQLAISSPYSSDMDDRLEASLARLRIAEEVAAEFGAMASPDAERGAVPMPPPARASSTATASATASPASPAPSSAARAARAAQSQTSSRK